MLKVGITGGIGSGKTTVCQLFELLGVPVFYADDAAKWLMNHDASLISSIKELLGDAAYKDNSLDRAFVASVVFSQPEKLQQLNALVHPASMRYANDWAAAQTTHYTLKEAALFFESGSDFGIEIMIGVAAPEELRIQRAMKRSKASRADIVARVAQQMNEAEKMSRCDYIITNDDLHALIPQVLALHRVLLSK